MQQVNKEDKDIFNIAIYVHDLVREIGHSRAMIESLNNIPNEKIKYIYVVSFSCDKEEIIFRNSPHKVKFYKVPKYFQKPFLIKMLYFYIMSYLIKLFMIPKDTKHIGIGTAALCVDYVNIQFIQEEWSHLYFKYIRNNLLKTIYKKILFFFFIQAEKYLYRIRKDVKFSVLSQFEVDYLKSRFKVDEDRIILNYSGVNFDNFSIPEKSRLETFMELKSKYNDLDKIDPTKPTYLFVGAFERKGLKYVIEKVKKIKDSQLIIVGKPESGSYDIELTDNMAHIPYTKEIEKVYAISDTFVFPTIYEPFGLVLLEAAVMGLEIYTLTEKVGASELLHGIEGVHLFEDLNSLEIKTNNFLTREMRVSNRIKRKEVFERYTWEMTGENFYKLLSSTNLS